jgi:tripartite-type tricarboxylate transporter receptor subunit TctC
MHWCGATGFPAATTTSRRRRGSPGTDSTNDPYAIAKIAGLKLCESYNRQHGTRYVSVMPTNLYGPNDNFDLATSHVLPALLRKSYEAAQRGDASLPVWGSGRPLREFLHVDGMADACVFLMEREPAGEVFNIGTGRDVTIRERADIVVRTTGFEGALRFDSTKPDGTPRKLLDVSRLAALGRRARIDLVDGIRRTCEWFLANHPAHGPVREQGGCGRKRARRDSMPYRGNVPTRSFPREASDQVVFRSSRISDFGELPKRAERAKPACSDLSQVVRPMTSAATCPMRWRTTRMPPVCGVLATVFLGAASTTGTAHAQPRPYPERPIRLIVPYPAGGGVDIVARAVSGRLADALGQPVVVDNRPGAGSVIGVDLAAKAQADGHTLLFVNLAYAVNATLVPKLPYDPLQDLAPVSLIATQPHVVVVHPSVPVSATRELIALARARHGHVTYASSGVGTGPHLAAELFSSMTGVRLNHIPYKGAAPALTDVMGGHAQVMFATIVSAIAHLQSGRLRVIAVTSAKRAQVLPAVPTVAEAGVPSYEAVGWYMLLVRAGTAAPVLARIRGGMTAALDHASVRDRLIGDGAEVVGNRPEEATRFLRNEIARWGAVVKSAALKPE